MHGTLPNTRIAIASDVEIATQYMSKARRTRCSSWFGTLGKLLCCFTAVVICLQIIAGHPSTQCRRRCWARLCRYGLWTCIHMMMSSHAYNSLTVACDSAPRFLQDFTADSTHGEIK